MLAALLIMGSFLSGLPSATPVSAAIGSVTQYSTPGTGSVLSNIGTGPDGNIWYTSYGPATTTRVGKVTSLGTFTEYLNRTPNSRYPESITTGSDGNLWYSEYGPNNESRIVKMSISGTVLNVYVIASSIRAESLVLCPDGDVWFVHDGKIGRINTSGATNFYTPPYGTGKIHTVTPGPDGNIWYVAWSTGSSNKHSVGKMTPSGVFTNYPFTTMSGYFAQDITAGTDGNLWATMPGRHSVLKITTSGMLTEYTTGTGSRPYAIAAASDGNLWYVGSGIVGRITPTGAFTNFSVTGIGLYDNTKNIVSGADGAVWVYDSNQYGTITRVAVELTSQIINFTSVAPGNAVIDGQTYTPTASASSGLPVVITVDPSSSTVCSIDGSGIVSFQGAGTCVINADQAGDADYKPAPRVQQSFTVNPVESDTSVNLSCPHTTSITSTVSCIITVANTGEATAENLKLTALISDSLTNASLSGGGVLAGQEITWTTPSLASGASATLTFNATASARSRASISASLLQTNPDSSILNNIADAKIKIQ